MAKNTKTLSADVVKLSEEVKKLSAELAKTKRGTVEYTVAYNKLVKAIKETTAASTTLEERTKKLSSANRTHIQSLNAAATAQRNFNSAVKDASGAIKSASSGGGFLDKFLGSFTPQKLGSTLGTVTRFLGVGGAVFTAIEGLKQLTTESFKTFVSLEQQFASLSAISGATAEQMNNLQKATFEVASSTGYTTSEIIQLETSLVKLGVPIESVTSSLGTIAMSSRALGADLSQVGELLFKVSDQFGLTQSELGSTASNLVKSINESALSFEEFGTAIQYVGPIANQVGLTFQQTTGYMEILSNAGFRASKIGTGLRDIFIDIKTPGEELSDTIARLAGENLSLSEAVDLVGKTSAAQLFVLLRNADAIKRLSDETLSADDALREMSDLLRANSTQMNTTQGRLNSLSTAWEAYKNRIGQAITSTELFIRLLGILDSKAEATARAYNRIANLSQSQFNLLSQQFAAATGPFQRAQIASTAINKEELESLRKTYQLSVPTGDKKAGLTFEKFLEEVSLGRREQGSNAGQALFGLTNALNEIRNQTEQQNKIIKIREEQAKQYSAAYTKLEDLTGKALEKEADVLLTRLAKDSQTLQDSLLITPDDQELQARLNVVQGYTNKVSELLSGEIANAEKANAEREKIDKEREEKLKENQDAELKRLKDLIESRKLAIEDQRLALFLELEIAKSRNDVLKVAELENKIIENKAKAYSELLTEIGKAAYLTEDQKVVLTGQLSQFDTTKQDVFTGAESIAKSFQEAAKDMSVVDATVLGVSLIENIITGFEKAAGNLPPDVRKQLTEALQTIFFNPEIKVEEADQTDELSEKRKKEIEDAIQALSSLTSAFADGAAELNDVAFENLKNRLDAEKDAIKERYDYEQKILEAQVENQLITQEEYERKLEQVQKRRIQKENQVNKKIFEAEKKRDRQNASLQFAETLASIVLNNYKKFDSFTASAASIVAGITATAQYGLKLSAINQREFVPVRFAEGGLVNGPSHAEGGVPFSVKGRGGYEMEGGEFIINKEATKRNYSLLKNINDSVKPSKYSTGRKFAAGGLVNAEEMSVRQIELLENIAYATGTTSINTSKPVRAFVATEDLRKSDVDLRIRERNSNL
jgi:hypothetical protein